MAAKVRQQDMTRFVEKLDKMFAGEIMGLLEKVSTEDFDSLRSFARHVANEDLRRQTSAPSITSTLLGKQGSQSGRG